MYKFERYRQLGLADFNQPAGLKMNPENRWVKKAETIPWDAIKEKYAQLFPSNTGMPAKPLRTALGFLLIQKQYGYADRELSDASDEGSENSGTIILDATCAPQNISYPQDINLLNEARENRNILYRMCKGYDMQLFQRYRRRVRKDYLAFDKGRIHTKNRYVQPSGNSFPVCVETSIIWKDISVRILGIFLFL